MRTRTRFGIVALPILLALPTALHSQDGFLFMPPQGTFTLRVGMARPTVSGELFESMFSRHTMGSGDFGTAMFGADFLLRASDHVDVGASFEWSRSAVKSEFRDFVYPDDSPIQQKTVLRRMPLTLNARVYPMSRGEAVSSFAWIPERFSPYVGGGLGMMFYNLRQNGDFVDKDTFLIFEDDYETGNPTFTMNAVGGADYWFSPRVGITGEARYTYAKADPEYPFDFDEIDLSGWQLTAGLALRF